MFSQATANVAGQDLQLVTTLQAAGFLGVTAQYLKNDRSSGRALIPFVRIGRLVRYRLADLRRIAETGASSDRA